MESSYDKTTEEYSGSVNVDEASFWAFDIDGRKLNGTWIDFAMVITVTVYLSICNFWVIFRSCKIILSQKTIDNLKKYAQIESERSG